MKPAPLNESLALALSVLLALLGAFCVVGLASIGLGFPWALLPLLLGLAGIYWLLKKSLPDGEDDPKAHYFWRVEALDDQVLIAAQNVASQQRVYFGSRIFLGLIAVLCAGTACFAWTIPFVSQGGLEPDPLYFFFGLVFLLVAANCAYNLQKTPFLALMYRFDSAAQQLMVSGKNWRGQVQTQRIAFANIKQVYAVTGKGSAYIRHHMIRIDALKPHRYFVINAQSDNIEEARYYLEAICTVMPEKVRDELGAGKLWIEP